ncbi:long-chain fatty acid--CoA ligase [candidate division KSB1 bacterium]|nr:long-chain fatty acid--CoA ligase [candidate division KSB1 bacterium]
MPETLADAFFHIAEKFRDKPALMQKIDGVYTDITYGSFAETVADLAYAFHDAGLQKNDKIAILSENRPEWVYTDLAALSLGCLTVPVYPTMSSKQIEYILNDSHSKIVVLSQPEHLASINDIFNNLKDLKRVITLFHPEDDPHKIATEFQDFKSKGEESRKNNPDFLINRRKELDASDLATIIYTSGTTGVPKGVMLTHTNFIEEIKSVKEIISFSENDLFLSFLPLSHVYERMAGYYLPLSAGSTIAYAESTEKVGDNMREVHPTVMISVPRLYEKMYALVQDNVAKSSVIRKILFRWCLRAGKAHYLSTNKGHVSYVNKRKFALADKLVFKKLRMRTGGKIRFFVSGGAPLPKEIAEFFAYAGITILEGYGLTETAALVAVNTPGDCRPGTVGKPPPGIELKIADDGEICTRGLHIMKGYYNKPEETKKVMDENGWFYTGDIGFIDKDGFLTITDRKKNLIVTSSGKNIAPQPIENLMAVSRYIEQIMMIGDRRKFPSAVVVPAYNNLEEYLKSIDCPAASRKEMAKRPETYELIDSEIKRLSADLSNFEVIKKFIILENELTQENGELTPTFKVKRSVVEKKFAKQIDKMYSE